MKYSKTNQIHMFQDLMSERIFEIQGVPHNSSREESMRHWSLNEHACYLAYLIFMYQPEAAPIDSQVRDIMNMIEKTGSYEFTGFPWAVDYPWIGEE